MQSLAPWPMIRVQFPARGRLGLAGKVTGSSPCSTRVPFWGLVVTEGVWTMFVGSPVDLRPPLLMLQRDYAWLWRAEVSGKLTCGHRRVVGRSRWDGNVLHGVLHGEVLMADVGGSSRVRECWRSLQQTLDHQHHSNKRGISISN
jgi:hypothetical protein